MKNIFLGLMAIALVCGTAFASNDDGGGKKKKKQAKTECKVEICDPTNCDPKKCEPKNCDPKDCNSKCVGMASATAKTTCPPAACSGN